MNFETYRSLEQRMTTDHGETVYLDVGSGPVVVFVHGVFVSSYLWRDVIDDLSKDHRCIVYNLPGHGGSRVNPEQDLSLASQAAMFNAFCDALGLADFDLVANDTGGAVAQAFAVEHADRIRTLTLTNCEANDQMPSSNDFAQLITSLAEKGELAPALVEYPGNLELARGPLGLGPAVQYPERLTLDDLKGYFEPHYSTLDNAKVIERFLTSLAPGQLMALEPRLEKLNVPTLLVWGTGDEIFDLECAEWLRSTIPGCRELVEIDGGRLFWPGERGDELVPHLRRHFAAARAPSIA